MRLDQKYDAYYAGDKERSAFRDVQVPGWPRNRYEAIVCHCGSGQSVLDIGCGDGYLLYQVRSRFKQLVGMEYSESRLAQAELNLAGLPFRPICGSAEDMAAIDSGSIDEVISADTIEHVPDVYAAAKEIFRVLRPGGRLLINTPNIAFVKKRVLLLLGRFPSTSQPNEGLGGDILFDGGHLHYFTYRSLRLVFEAAGFRSVRKVGFGRLGRVHDVYPELLSGAVQIEFSKY